MTTLPLHALHQRQGATFGRLFGWEAPLRYGDVADEYLAATQGVALVDRSYLGRIRAFGHDALDLLNRLSTNKLEALPPGAGAATVLTTNKGRIIDLLLVESMEDHLLLVTSPQQRRRVVEWIDLYTFTEDLRLEDVTAETTMVELIGPRAAEVVRALTGTDAGALDRLGWVDVVVAGTQMSLLRTDAAGAPRFGVVAPASQGEEVWKRLLEMGEGYGVVAAGYQALEALRVEQGIPQYGAELSEAVNPLEARLKGFISFNKGCYIGQEVVARLNTYAKVQRWLMAVALAGPAQPGDTLEQEGQRVGTLTSVAQAPGKGWRALAYVRGGAARAGARVQVARAGVEGVLDHPPFAVATEPVEV